METILWLAIRQSSNDATGRPIPILPEGMPIPELVGHA